MATSHPSKRQIGEGLRRDFIDYGSVGSADDPTVANRCRYAFDTLGAKRKRTPKKSVTAKPVVQAHVPSTANAIQMTFDDMLFPQAPAKTIKVTPPPAPQPKPLTPSFFAANLIFHPQDRTIKHKQSSSHPNINWPLFENVLKLYAFIKLYNTDLTPQQRLDRDTLIQTVEEMGNTNPDGTQRAGRHLNALQIIDKAMGPGRLVARAREAARRKRKKEATTQKPKHPYLQQGLMIIQARTELREIAKREWAAEHLDQKMSFDALIDLERRRDVANNRLSQISAITADTSRDEDYRQRVNMTQMANTVFDTVRHAYKTKTK
ncbi:MAG: hypothetical protein II938_01300 [Alphaproteobacteria bacterium]|nr:hypothetical protein [Alphaproteobacteria bacterium]